MEILLASSSFILGTIIGSFLNVVILRYNTGRGLEGRSTCLSCGKSLKWIDLIPILSFLLLRGQCRYCGSRFSLQYPLIELVTGVIFAVLAGMLFEGLFNIVFLLKLIYVFAIASLLIAISVYDLKHTIIPDKLVYVLVFLSFASLFANGALSTEALLAGPLTALPLGFLWLVSGGKWMGLGDAKLQLALGWLLGLTQGVSALVLSFWIGAAVSVGVITIPYVIQRMYLFGTVSKLTMKSEIAFGPFLVLGFVITWMFNIDLISLLLFS